MPALDRKRVLITDIRGFANPVIARRLVDAGALVAGVDRAIVADAEEDGVRLLAWDEPEALVERAASVLGGLDAIVVAQALPAQRTPIDSVSAAGLQPYFSQLAIEALVFASAAAKIMRAQRSGRIVFVTSSGHIGGIPGFVAYAAARAAVNGAVRTMALELAADGISVNAVAPNFIQTETYYPKALVEDPVKGPKLLARIPMGRLGRADEVAALIELLAVGDSAFVSGQVIPISGAWC